MNSLRLLLLGLVLASSLSAVVCERKALAQSVDENRNQLKVLVKSLRNLRRTRGISAYKKSAVDACLEQLQLSDRRLDQVKKSLKRTSFDSQQILVWISAARSLARSCSDDLELATEMATKGTKLENGGKVLRFSSVGGVVPTSTPKASSNDPEVPLGSMGEALSEAAEMFGSKRQEKERKLLSDSQEGAQEASMELRGNFHLANGNLVRGRSLQSTVRNPEPIPDPTRVVDPLGANGYSSIQSAVDSLPDDETRQVILIRAGTYNERVVVKRNYVTFVGEGADVTRVVAAVSVELNNVTTSQTSTVAVSGDYFVAVNMSFVNASPREGRQAVALLVNSDFSAFHRCTIQSFQDSLYSNSGKQYYRDCTIIGTVDFVFGNGISVFEYCTLQLRQNLDTKITFATAHSRDVDGDITGYVFNRCKFVAFNAAEAPYIVGYFGRPWRAFSRVVIANSFLDKIMSPKGFAPWNFISIEGSSPYYAEYKNNGQSAVRLYRFEWQYPGEINDNTFFNFMPDSFIKGNQWVRQQGVPYY